jgi:hypothetical protein
MQIGLQWPMGGSSHLILTNVRGVSGGRNQATRLNHSVHCRLNDGGLYTHTALNHLMQIEIQARKKYLGSF